MRCTAAQNYKFIRAPGVSNVCQNICAWAFSFFSSMGKKVAAGVWLNQCPHAQNNRWYVDSENKMNGTVLNDFDQYHQLIIYNDNSIWRLHVQVWAKITANNVDAHCSDQSCRITDKSSFMFDTWVTFTIVWWNFQTMFDQLAWPIPSVRPYFCGPRQDEWEWRE